MVCEIAWAWGHGVVVEWLGRWQWRNDVLLALVSNRGTEPIARQTTSMTSLRSI